MYDLFDILHLDTREDAYTYCLIEFLERSKEFRLKSADKWGFKNADYKVFRETINLENETKGGRKKIIPDIVLYSDDRIAVIESKMFASEGYEQTMDYQYAQDKIKQRVAEKANLKNEVSIGFYFFTLAGVQAKSDIFKPVQWTDYYRILTGIEFGDAQLDAIKMAILRRTEDYCAFVESLNRQRYKDLTRNDNCWICPFALFSSGRFDNLWGLNEQHHIYNGEVNGTGHSTFRTDIYLEKNMICGKHEDDNIYLFTRIEWEAEYVNVVLSMEYWKVRNNDWLHYIPNNRLEQNKDAQEKNRDECLKIIKKMIDQNDDIRIPTKKSNMLQMLIKTIRIEGDESVSQIIEKISKYRREFENILDEINKHIIRDGEFLIIV